MIGSESLPANSLANAPMFGVPNAAHRPLAPGTRTLEKRVKMIAVAIAMLWFASFFIGFKTTIGLMTGLGFALALVGIQAPMYGLIGIGILCSIDSLTRSFLMTGGFLRYNTFNYFLVFLMITFLPLHFRQKDIHTSLMRAFAVLLLLGLIWSPGVKNGILHIVNFVTVFGLYTYFYRCRHNPRMWYLIALTVGLSSACGGAAFFFNRDGLSFVDVREEYLINDIRDDNYIDPNALCYFFVTALFALGFGLASNTARGIEQTVLYLLFATNLCWTFLVGSRGGILVASACAVYVLFSARSATRRFQVVAAGIIAVLFVVNAFPQYRDRTIHRVDKLVDQDLTAAERTSSRSDFVVAAWRMFTRNPLGVGTGGFRYSWKNLDNTQGLSKGKLEFEKSSHSAWLKTIAENGFAGTLLFGAFVFSFMYVGFKLGRPDTIAVGMLVTTILSLSFTLTQFQSKGLWFLVAAAIVFLHHRRMPAPISPPPKRRPPILHAGMVVNR